MLAARPWAVAIAVVAHALLGAWLWLAAAPPRSGAVATGSGGVELALGPAGSTAGATTPSESPVVRPVAEPEPLPLQSAIAEVTAAPPAPLAATAEMADAVALSAPSAAPPAITEQATLPAPESQAVTTAVAQPPSPSPRAMKATEPAAPRRPKPAPRPATVTAADPGAAVGKSGATAAPDSGSGDQSAGGGKVGDSHDYLATLAAWLERHKQYPQQARARGEEGTVLLRFTIDRHGRLLAWKIDRGSGSAALDREVGTMLQRAEPLPPIPDAMAQAQLELAVPIRFRLR